MIGRARHQTLRLMRGFVRRAWLAASVLLAGGSGVLACEIDLFKRTGAIPASMVQQRQTHAAYANLTRRYSHGVLGDALEPETLLVEGPNAGFCDSEITLDTSHVFEDVAPRLVDLDRDGVLEIVTVRSHINKGAQIAVYGFEGRGEVSDLKLLATTPYIGRKNRWLAPIGAADLDGDGHIEIAYIDRPHLAKTLRVWRFKSGKLTEVANQKGLTNHRIGEDFISGGIRDCGTGSEMITVDANWQKVMATRFDGKRLMTEPLGGFTGQNALQAALNCGSN